MMAGIFALFTDIFPASRTMNGQILFFGRFLKGDFLHLNFYLLHTDFSRSLFI